MAASWLPAIVTAVLLATSHEASGQDEERTPLAPCLSLSPLDATPLEAHRYLGKDFAEVDAHSIFATEIGKLPVSTLITAHTYVLILKIKRFETSGYIGFGKHAAGEVTASVTDRAGAHVDQFSTTCFAKAPLTIASPDTRIRSAARLCLLDAGKALASWLGERLGPTCMWREVETPQTFTNR
ncbi:hypothetical protein E6W36_15745 [Hankyongella ginsenosidimutans]|uniref:Uncharacterized protein n=1 Tax=Hankyongella ginsenosidimutans TaxID=1763828 RepID=A0A4D7CCD4_9SPHN|nr:hypothetical protein [Hankyongella ginsenosidimutans]QCI80442.1 hypothetical protein E6W36_15745 [Hankyongella ginsenosidimutans]